MTARPRRAQPARRKAPAPASRARTKPKPRAKARKSAARTAPARRRKPGRGGSDRMVGLANLLAGLLGLAVIVLFAWTIVRALEIVGAPLRLMLDNTVLLTG